ncbi:hypothetical protein BJX70DRAFT_147862 [Aspergillus crustosus]
MHMQGVSLPMDTQTTLKFKSLWPVMFDNESLLPDKDPEEEGEGKLDLGIQESTFSPSAAFEWRVYLALALEMGMFQTGCFVYAVCPGGLTLVYSMILFYQKLERIRLYKCTNQNTFIDRNNKLEQRKSTWKCIGKESTRISPIAVGGFDPLMQDHPSGRSCAWVSHCRQWNYPVRMKQEYRVKSS